MTATRGRWLAALLASAGCGYDFDELYTYEQVDGGGSGGGGDAGAPRSSHLIGLWSKYPTVDDECIRCAETSCVEAETACRQDPECVEFTRCVAETPTPAGLMACRARHLAWVTSGDVVQRDMNGPYGQCVFRNACLNECEGATDLSCLHNYSWPMSFDETVPLHLVFNDSMELTHRLAGIAVKVCLDGDDQCANPAATGISDANGYVKLDVPTGFTRAFTGFLDVQGGDAYPSLMKFSWQVGGPAVQLVTLVTRQTYEFFAGFAKENLKVSLSDDRAIVQMRILGCQGTTIKGVSFAASGTDLQTSKFYLNNGLPSLVATETDVLGAAGNFNQPTGYQTVTATRASDRAVLGQANIPVRAGFMSVLVFSPASR